MEREETIVEMVKDISVALGTKCLLNIGGHCRDCKYVDEDNAEHDCQSVLVANELDDKDYRKIHDGEVVLTREEYEELKQRPEEVYNEMNERMQKELAIEKRMGEVKAKQACQKIAKEILDDIFSDTYSIDGGLLYVLEPIGKKILYKKYGVEVKE